MEYDIEKDKVGTIRYYKKGTYHLHREDGPAMILSNGDKYWYINFELHREDGPAIERSDGSKEWYKNGLVHREDGPAVETSNGLKQWWINGKQLTEEEFNKLKQNNIKFEIDKFKTKRYYKQGTTILHREDGPAVENIYGDKQWFIGGVLHREDGPAIIDCFGDKIWYKNGQIHREGGPAIEHCSGDKYWLINEKLHREDGPAIEYNNGNKEYWIDDVQITEEEFNKSKENKMSEKKLTYEQIISIANNNLNVTNSMINRLHFQFNQLLDAGNVEEAIKISQIINGYLSVQAENLRKIAELPIF